MPLTDGLDSQALLASRQSCGEVEAAGDLGAVVDFLQAQADDGSERCEQGFQWRTQNMPAQFIGCLVQQLRQFVCFVQRACTVISCAVSQSYQGIDFADTEAFAQTQ